VLTLVIIAVAEAHRNRRAGAARRQRMGCTDR